MPSTVYLVDYENVHERGLYGIRMLTAEDNVYIIYTDNADKISLDCVNGLDVPLHTVVAPVGKQSLDMHLASLLGYMIGKEQDASNCYVIVSHDTDFDGIIRYWSSRFDTHNKVTRRYCISEDTVWIAPQVTDDSPCTDPSVQASIDHKALSRAIRVAIEKFGSPDSWFIPRIEFSKLCTLLNGMPEYIRERQRSGKKPLQLFKEQYADRLWIDQERGTIYAYLVKNPDEDTNSESAGESSAEESGNIGTITEEEATDMDDEKALLEDPTDLLPSTSYDDIIDRIVNGGMSREYATFIAPMVYKAECSGNTKLQLYNKLRKKFGSIVGARYYRELRDVLKL